MQFMPNMWLFSSLVMIVQWVCCFVVLRSLLFEISKVILSCLVKPSIFCKTKWTNEAARPNIFTWKLLTARSSQSLVWLYGKRFFWKRSCFFIFLLEYVGSCLLLIAQSSTSLQPDGPQPTVMRYLQIFLCLRQRAYIQSARSCLSKSASTIITSMSITMLFLQMPSHNEHSALCSLSINW